MSDGTVTMGVGKPEARQVAETRRLTRKRDPDLEFAYLDPSN
jgi:hypothetical protein